MHLLYYFLPEIIIIIPNFFWQKMTSILSKGYQFIEATIDKYFNRSQKIFTVLGLSYLSYLALRTIYFGYAYFLRPRKNLIERYEKAHGLL
jgi:hypothetical protein